jgi:hypothetical protein
MRWGDFYNRRNVPFPNIVHTLPGVWANNLQEIRFATDEPPAPMLRTRRNLKELARESRLLNDILPPSITFSGGKAVISRPGSQGAIYFTLGISADPKLTYLDPEFSSTSPGNDNPPIPAGEWITARVFGPDPDGTPGWSAPTLMQAP